MSTEWMDKAECLTVDPEVMQPERATRAEVADALAVCGPCPVRDACRALAESQDQPFGVHAGEWYGADPVWMVDRVCERESCGQVFRTEANGNHSARFCDSACRSAAHRERRVSA